MQLISDKILQDMEKSLGLESVEEKSKTETMKEIVELISSRAGFRIMKEFSEEESEEFNRIPEEDLKGMEQFIIAKNPNAGAIFEEEARLVAKEILKMRGR